MLHLPGAVNRGGRASSRREALTWGHYNGALWSFGNGLTTGAYVTYLALELGARGRHLSLILAMPAAVGLLRLFTPALIRAFGSAKRACLGAYLASYLLLWLQPAMALPVREALPVSPLAILVIVLCTHQLLEHVGTVALWNWLGQLVPQRIRGRYFARRQAWQLAVLIPTLLASGWFTDQWRAAHPDQKLLGYAIPSAVGVVGLLLSLIPLTRMPSALPRRATSSSDVPDVPASATQATSPWRGWLAPLADANFRRLTFYGCWLAFFNGVTQSAQGIYPKEVLGIGVLAQSSLSTLMRLGQLSLAPRVGWGADRFGNRPVAILAQLVVAAGPLFFLLATPEQPWWLVGAYLAWSAYVGLNVCLPNLMLRLSPQADAHYVASYFALSGLAYGASTLASGWLFDALSEMTPRKLGPLRLDHFALLFLAGWLTRSCGALILATIREPEAWRWSELLRGERRRGARVNP